MGKLGWTEYEYYTCSPEGFYYACQGYYAKLKDESMATRRLANFVFQLGGGKGNFDTFWPISDRVAQVVEPPTKEWWAKMKAKHNKK